MLLLFVSMQLCAQDDMVSFEIRGNVTTDDGLPVINATMQISFTKITVDENEITQTSDEVQVVNTDEEGNYTFQLNLDPDWSDFILRITSSTVDRFRYNTPQERLLTDAIRDKILNGVFNIEVNWVFTSRPTWQEELEEIRKYGEDSEKGRLIRRRGLADKIVKFTRDGKEGEIWLYYGEGIAVRFLGDQREKVFSFKPRPKQQ